MKNWKIILTFFGLWISTQLQSEYQELIAYFLILTLGILHGANDLFILKKVGDQNHFRKNLLQYIAVIGLVVLSMFLMKSFTLALFVIVSGYHFGEQHLEHQLGGNRVRNRVVYLSYGMVILFLLFFMKYEAVNLVFQELIGIGLSRSFFLIGLCSSLALLLTLLGYGYYQKELHLNLLQELFHILSLVVVFHIASLVWAFAIYFIFWHSLPSIKDQMEFLYGEASQKTFMTYLKTSLLYWVLSLAGLAFIYLYLRNEVDLFLTIVLYVLTAITFPHVVVMSRIFKVKN